MSNLEGKSEKTKLTTIINKNFVLYYVYSAILIFLYSTQYYNIEYGYYDMVGSISSTGVILCLLLPFVIIFYDRLKLHYKIRLIAFSFLSNLFFTSFVIYLFLWIQGYYTDYWTNGYNGMVFLWYSIVGLIYLFYVFRKELNKFITKLYHQIIINSLRVGHYTKKYGYKITFIPFFLEWLSVRNLNNNYQAVFFTKKFIIIQSKPIKSILPGLHPSNVSPSIKNILSNDVERLQQLFRYNHIRTYSKGASLKFAMKMAEPIIKDLQLTLEQHLTEELLKENNDAKNLSINIDNLWKKVEKIMVNWESTFSESELEYNDTLLHK